MITANPRLDELLFRRNQPPQGGGINPYPHILGIHNCEDTDLTIDSSKPRLTWINSPAVQAWRESSPLLAGAYRKGRTESDNELNSVPSHPSYRDRQLRSFAHFNCNTPIFDTVDYAYDWDATFPNLKISKL
ncbi:hypothetical protein PIB30_071918 [Stylosanthes scabra]|uniref:Uncharacterized protein n=1 Tax=Stylosanthes scabra TaxID=79078 RepID=A0ABU6UMP3_9FABA|nr:hypothetical protein [Stylosanthes scabra]